MQEAPSTITEETAEPIPAKSGGGKRKRAGVILLAIALASCGMGVKMWISSKTHIATDNAFIESNIHAVSAKVAGTVKSVPVKDNQFVRKGDLLLELDQADYQVRVANAAASLDMAKNETAGEYAEADAAKASTELARARLEQANLDLSRGKALYGREVIPKEQLDRLQTARKIAASQLKEAEETLRRARANLGVSPAGGKEARVAQKAAQLAETRLNLSYTRIYAPADGYITRKSVEPGNNIQPGQPLMALVPLENAWITANYKERQLTNVKPGQKVEFEVDAYPGQKFKGSVDSIMAGTGAAFSLLPPENATGNYVKVVQRIPVKIVIDPSSDPDHKLRVGMSVVPTILTGQRLGDIIRGMNPFR